MSRKPFIREEGPRDPSRIIFLDMDGVLNRTTPGEYSSHRIHPECVAAFNLLVEASRARVVLSSAWRYMVLQGSMTVAGFNYLLHTHRVRCKLIDVTRRERGRWDVGDERMADDPRSAQVLDWLGFNPGPWRPLVLDDHDAGFTAAGLPFIHTDPEVGLTPEDAYRGVVMLREMEEFRCPSP